MCGSVPNRCVHISNVANNLLSFFSCLRNGRQHEKTACKKESLKRSVWPNESSWLGLLETQNVSQQTPSDGWLESTNTNADPRSLHPDPHWTRRLKCKQMKPAVGNGSVHTARSIKASAHKLAHSYPLWIVIGRVPLSTENGK